MSKKFVSIDGATGADGVFRRGFQVESVVRLVNDSDPSGADEPLEFTLETPGARPDETIRLNAGEVYPGPVAIRVVRIEVSSPNGADVPFRAEGTLTEGGDLRETPQPASSESSDGGGGGTTSSGGGGGGGSDALQPAPDA